MIFCFLMTLERVSNLVLIFNQRARCCVNLFDLIASCLFTFWFLPVQTNKYDTIMVVIWHNFDQMKHRAPTLANGMAARTFPLISFHTTILSRLQLSPLSSPFFHPSFPFPIKLSICVLGHSNLRTGIFFINSLLHLQPPCAAPQWSCPGQLSSQLSCTLTRLGDYVEVKETWISKITRVGYHKSAV